MLYMYKVMAHLGEMIIPDMHNYNIIKKKVSVIHFYMMLYL